MTTGKHTIESGQEYNHLFQKAKGEFIDVKQYAMLGDTIGLMKEVIAKSTSSTTRIADLLKAATLKETCRNVWNWCFRHIQYEKDEFGVEQVRHPARTWADRRKGVDCDCLTVIIGSILTNLRIPFVIRITKYQAQDFEHVYPVAMIGNEEVIMDCVVHKFNYEVPYTEKKDFIMKLQYLNGLPDDDDEEDFDSDDSEDFDLSMLPDLPSDAEAFSYLEDDLEGLEGKAQRKEKKAARKEKREDKKEERQEKREERKENKPPLKERIKNVANKVNKLNPVTALLRAGVLASMKANIGKVASKLRYSYWTREQALKNNMNPNAYDQLVAVRKKLEGIFYGAGGTIENLKKSILEGNGNKDRKVPLNGLGAVIQYVSDDDDLQTMVGHSLYFDEFEDVDGTAVHGFGEIGSAVAAIAAASGAIGTIMAFIKKIGALFKKGTAEEQSEVISDNTNDAEEKDRKLSIKNIAEIATKLPTNPVFDLLTKQGADVLKEQASSSSSAGTDYGSDSGEAIHVMDASELSEDDDPSYLPMVREAEEQTSETPTKVETPATIPETLPTSTAPATGDTKSTPPKETGMLQWFKDNKLATAGIAIAGLGLLYWAYTAQKAKKAKEAAVKNLSGTPLAKPGKKRTKKGSSPSGVKRVTLR
ncbi:MAG: hypothetical protein A3D31_17530 [Candidatus Fluviicola riflensis]|nr:MAG: hypothetical protein CHH17_02470 [Candidatus Fluviicola riflensis]OGS76786.1 MAG: hypothetical protein A3D31_17530 [Candidatus Fluviicola riflensis]OGS82859.1 MAG: hypothetical protein A2724_13830 [Fluviicola sp. RIFCSPHIGHO2_01_FULL_43_53]OGS88516.1 MAG: hypothetical protein A3E30_07035 [Fluviicola sp. RIFCSPHIGHO2_12_FULL_43_24]